MSRPLDTSVLLRVGDETSGVQVLISREEIAAAAAMWPVKAK